MDVGALTPPLWGFEEREKLMVFYERASGAACTPTISASAACTRICRRSSIDDIDALCETHPKVLDDISSLFTDNRIFKQRNVDIGVVTKDAFDWGFTGVMLRGSGVAWDLRATSPTSATTSSSSTSRSARTATATTATSCAWRRCASRCKIMQQCCDKLRSPEGQGPVVADDNKVTPPRRAEMKRSMEALIHHFKLYTEGFHVPAGEVYAAVEAPKGEFGVYLVADGTNKPYRCKIRAPSFPHLQAMDLLTRDHMLADVSAILGSLDIVFGEIDR